MPNTIKLDYQKYREAFYYMLSKMNGKLEGIKKACKLFYFLDFDFFEAYDSPFTGETYIKKQMGPFPKYFAGMVSDLESEGYIRINYEKRLPHHENDTTIYSLTDKKITCHFTKAEQKMLDRVVRLYGQQTGWTLEKLSHTEAPWIGVEVGQEIPYELSYYRNTSNLKD